MSSISEHKESFQYTSIMSTEAATDFLREKIKEKCEDLFLPFLKTFSSFLIPRTKQSPPVYQQLTLIQEFEDCNISLINSLMRNILQHGFTGKKTVLGNESCCLRARIFPLPDKETGDAGEVDSILYYQRGKEEDYFKQSSPDQEFISADLYFKFNSDNPSYLAEYFCPIQMQDSSENTISYLIDHPPPIQIRRLSFVEIDSHMQNLSALFNQIARPEHTYLTGGRLKQDLAEFAYKWVFTAPYENEQGELADLFHRVLAQLHGYELTVTTPFPIHHQVLSTPYFPLFLKKYNQIVLLKG